MEEKLIKWRELHWLSEKDGPTAYCPNHKGMRLDAIDGYGYACDQHSFYGDVPTHTQFVCPLDNEKFQFDEDLWTLRRRFNSHANSKIYKNLAVVDLDNIYTPILKVEPKPKDSRYSIQVEVDETPTGKKLVIYAIDRENPGGKTQIFIDPQLDKLSFDATNDLHPNMIFAKVVAYFKDGKKASLEQE